MIFTQEPHKQYSVRSTQYCKTPIRCWNHLSDNHSVIDFSVF
jgi:hypothetical protein